jgi:hypothetical protein
MIQEIYQRKQFEHELNHFESVTAALA